MDNQDLNVVKTELFNINALENLTSHDGVSLDTKRLLKAYKRARHDGNKVQVVYEYGKLLKTLQKGRLYPQKGLGLQNFPSDVRSALAQQYYWDVDMVNSQPVILLQMCEKNGWLCNELRGYVGNRSQWLLAIMKDLDCDRAAAKQLCLATMFGGSYKRSPDFITRLSSELSQIGINLINANQDLLKIVSKEKNPAASCVAQILQDTEFRILRHIDAFFQQEERFMDTYIHDGGLVRKIEGETTFPEDLLRRAESEILRVFGYAISLDVKPLTHTFEFKRDVMRTKFTSEKDYQQRKDLFEENHFYCEQTASICTITPLGLIHTSKNDSCAGFSSFNFQKTLGQKIIVDRFMPIWLDDPVKRSISKLIFYPDVSHQPEGCYNTFCGLQGAIEMDMPSHADKIIERFNELVFINAGCRENDALYLKKWLAHGVQLPHKVPGVAIVLINESQGTGKETLMDFMGNRVFGKEYYKNIKNVETELFDSHSTAMDKTLFLKLEEVNGSLNRKFADILKGIITSTTATINPKGIGKYTIDAFPRVVMTTNNAVPVKVEKDDRRFCIFYTSAKYMGNTAFWNETYSLFDSPEAGHVIHQYLMGLDLSRFEVKLFPKTDYHQGLAETEVASEKEFINQCDAFTNEFATPLHTQYVAYCHQQGYTPKGVVQFARMLTPMVETQVITRRMLDGRSVYSKSV